MRRLVILALPLLAACASAASSPGPRSERPIVSMELPGGTTNMQLTREASVTSGTLQAAPDQVWASLLPLFAELGLEVTEVIASDRVVGSIGQRISRIAGKSISTYVSCPGSYGNAAGRSDVYLSVQSRLEAAAGGTTVVRTEVAATARSTTSASTILCNTTGALESMLMEELAARTLAPPAADN